MKILICPYSKLLRNGKRNPKNYPWWKEFIQLANTQGHLCTQLGESKEKPIPGMARIYNDCSMLAIEKLIHEHDIFVSIDSFLPHMCRYYNKRGIVIFGVSDPDIFGYSENINLLKDRKYLRPRQFEMWEAVEYNEEVFVSPNVVINAVRELYAETVR